MGNRLSCSCAPLIRKAYRYEDTPWQNARKRDGHLLRLWAEVFHVSTSGSGSVRWQQISEDLVPVNISCIQDHPECVFHITAYNSQVDKILDVRLTQPGTRIGQASECFVYWKDPVTNDTWGLNFTSPVDARQFRECCSPASKFSRKASSSYSLRLEPSSRQRDPIKINKRKTLSTPASPSHTREPQCTCMTPEQYARLRAQDPRHRGTVTLPRTQGRTECDNGKDCAAAQAAGVSGGVSTSSVYDNISGTMKRSVEPYATIRNMRSSNGNPSEPDADNSKTAANSVANSSTQPGGNGETPPSSSSTTMSATTQSAPITTSTLSQQQHPTSVSQTQQTTQTQTVTQGTTPSLDEPKAIIELKTSHSNLQETMSVGTGGSANPTPKLGLTSRQFSQPGPYNPVQFYETCPDAHHESFNHSMRNLYAGHSTMYPGSHQPSPYGFRQPQAGYYVPSNAYPAYALDPSTGVGGFHAGSDALYGGSAAGEPHLMGGYHVQARGGPYPPLFYPGGNGEHKGPEDGLRPGSRTLPAPRRGELLSSKSVDYADMDPLREADNRSLSDLQQHQLQRRNKSKSSEDMQGLGLSRSDLATAGLMSFDSTALKRMLQPVTCFESPMNSPMTSPEMSRRRCPGRGGFEDGFLSEPENGRGSRYSAGNGMSTRGSDLNYGPHQRASQSNANTLYKAGGGAIGGSMSNGSNGAGGDGGGNGDPYAHRRAAMRDHLRLMRGHSAAADTLRQNLERSLYLDFERDGGSPASDNILFDNHCYATTPSSSTGNSDMENNIGPSSSSRGGRDGVNAASPTSRLLLEYEMHLRNTLAKGLDAESCSLHTFEALLTQSTENLGAIPSTLPLSMRERAAFNNREVDTGRSRCSERGSIVGKERDADPNRSFYSDCAEMERSIYAERDRGYLSDISSRANSLYERQDSLKSGYMSDRESRHYGVVQQTSLESADSRLCYLTSSEMSDDDRMSLTTAVSDDDDGESEADVNSHGHTKKSVAAASFNCTGALRKAGFLSVKKWLLRKKHQVELARKRGWRGYWVCLKGTTLLFYPCDSREGRTVEAAPKHLIIVDGAIMQPIPEHPKRDFIFCLSTAFGDAYLFQAPCQAELDTWVNSIHCACAASFARHRGKTGTLHLLQEEIFRLERSIESDNKLKHMAEMQLSVVSDPENRRQIGAQISAWEENLERLHCEQFRLRCYMASLQHGELPNPKGLLAHVSRNTKGILNRLGVFTVSSFHAYICARSPSLLNNLLAGRGATRRRAAPPLSRSNSVSSRKSQSLVATPAANENEQLFKVNLPDSQHITITVRDSMTVEEFLSSACTKRSLNPAEHFVRVKKRRDMDNSNHFVPHRSDLIESYIHSHEVVEVCAKSLYQVELSRSSLDHMWGFSVEAELVENMDRQDELCCFVSRVEDRSVAMTNGIIKSDEIMVINGALVGDLDMMYIESVLQEELSLCLMMRSCRADPPDITCLLKTTDDIIDSLVCPPPPSDALITDDVISGLIVPAPSWSREVQSPGEVEVYRDRFAITRQSAPEIVGLLKVMDSDRNVCRSSSSSEARRSSPTGSVASSQSQVMTPNRQLTDAEKLRKVVLELIETERTYVKNLNALLENYLEPLKQETFLSTAEINVLFGNIQEIVAFQRLFLQSLEEALHGQPDFERWDQTRQFKAVLLSIGNSFLFYAQHFKLYSSFCASHSKAQKVLLPNEGSQALQEFLQSRNPKQQHSSTLESYLIKPIQRILKYPLLLQQLKLLTEPNAEEHQLLIEALKSMEKVAEHINEMQRIHEEYGAIFEHLFRQHQKSCKQPVDLSPGDLLYYGGVEWLNISDFLGKVKKGLELHAMCFVFKTAVVFLCKERLRQKKKLMSVTTKASAPEVEIIRYQVLIPVTEVQVRAAATKDLDAHFLWELIHLKNPLHRRSEKVYHLSNSTAEFRNAFLKTIRQIIRESVRNMSIPPAKPGNSVLVSSPRLLSSSSSSSGNPKTLSLASGAGSLRRKSPRNAQRHSAGNIDYDNLEPTGNSATEDANFGGTLRARSQTVGDGIDCIGGGNGKEEQKDSDPGAKSESEDEPPPPKAMLGRTPNHLSLSTTSTLSTGSTSSQAKLIQSSNTPQNYQPQYAKPLGSPIWKPRDIGESFTLPRSTRSGATNNTSTRDQPLRAAGDLSKSMYGTLAPGHDQSTHSFY